MTRGEKARLWWYRTRMTVAMWLYDFVRPPYASEKLFQDLQKNPRFRKLVVWATKTRATEKTKKNDPDPSLSEVVSTVQVLAMDGSVVRDDGKNIEIVG